MVVSSQVEGRARDVAGEKNNRLAKSMGKANFVENVGIGNRHLCDNDACKAYRVVDLLQNPSGVLNLVSPFACSSQCVNSFAYSEVIGVVQLWCEWHHDKKIVIRFLEVGRELRRLVWESPGIIRPGK
jgi:hypothetical protein